MAVTDETIEALTEAARRAANSAYAPYSHFRVGAALLDENGEIHWGCNVENASYGLSCCAERNAIFAMVASGGRRITILVVYTPTGHPTRPCGACRQVIAEFSADCPVVCVCDGATRFTSTSQALLPDRFELGG